MAEIKLNADFLNDLYACKDVHGVIVLAKTKGIDLTEEQAGKVFESFQGRELTDEELEQVTGGAGAPGRTEPPDRFVLVKKGANGEPYVDVALTHF